MPLHRSAHISLPTALLVLLVLFLHARYVTLITEPNTTIPLGTALRSIYKRDGTDARGQLPDLFIFRRSKKTASTSMANALLSALIPYGYEPSGMKNFEISTYAANAFVRAKPRRLIIVNHNQVTRATHPHVNAFENSFPKKAKVRRHSPLNRNYKPLRTEINEDSTDESNMTTTNRVALAPEDSSFEYDKDDELLDLTPLPGASPEEDSDEYVHRIYFDEPHARARVVIADTIRDGFQQITSYCRHMRGFSACDASLIPCIQSRLARAQMLYRFAGNEKETIDTYIDLPLSSSHPALSTTVLRSVYPEMEPLRIDRYNAHRYACRSSMFPELLAAYRDAGFEQLDEHVDMLRKRMLLIAGYPTDVRISGEERTVDDSTRVKTKDLLDAAEQLEQKAKYKGVNFYARPVSPHSKSAMIAQLLARSSTWTLNEKGQIVLTQRRTEIRVDETEMQKAPTW